jgi:hypothetical protein
MINSHKSEQKSDMFFQKIVFLIFLSHIPFSAEAARLLKKETLKKVLLPWVYRQYPDIQENLAQLNEKEVKSLAMQIAKVIAQSSAYRKSSQKEKNSAEKEHVRMIEDLLKKDQAHMRQKKKILTQDMTEPCNSGNKKIAELEPAVAEKSCSPASISPQTETMDPRQLWMEKRRAKINEIIAQDLENPTPKNLIKAQNIVDQALYEEMRVRTSLSLSFPSTVVLPNEDFLKIWQQLREQEPSSENITAFWSLLKILVQLNEEVEHDPQVREAALNKHWELSLPQKIHEECESILKIYQTFRKKYGNVNEIWGSLLTSTALDLLKSKVKNTLSPKEREHLVKQIYQLEKFPQWSESLVQQLFCFSPESLASLNHIYKSLVDLNQKITQSDVPESAPIDSVIFEYPLKVGVLKSLLS